MFSFPLLPFKTLFLRKQESIAKAGIHRESSNLLFSEFPPEFIPVKTGMGMTKRIEIRNLRHLWPLSGVEMTEKLVIPSTTLWKKF